MIQPTLDNVLIQRDEALEKTASGLYIPDTAKEKPLKGTVIAIGNKLSEKTPIKVGSKVLYKKYGGTETSIDGTDYIIHKEDGVLIVL